MAEIIRIPSLSCDVCGARCDSRIRTWYGADVCGACFTIYGPREIQAELERRKSAAPAKPAEVLQLARRQQPSAAARIWRRILEGRRSR